jgi:hypothetical protein
MSADDPVDIRRWLRTHPQPARLRVRTVDGDERMIELDESARNRWTHAEQSIRASQAYVVECLTVDGAILRSLMIDAAAADAGVESAEDKEDRHAEKRIASERRELAAVLDRYGNRLNEAFQRGAAAANTGQEHLVGLVETLTAHLSTAITSLHNVSVNFANTMQALAQTNEAPDQHTQNQEMLTKVLGAAAAQAMGANGKRTEP